METPTHLNNAARRLAPLPLPTKLPSAETIASFKTSAATYDPELWNFEYQVRRFLSRVPQRYLEWRYESIVRNLQRLVNVERDVIPIQSFLSSWYWFRKEYQTRLELALRGQFLPPPALALYGDRAAPIKPKSPNSGDVLFRYGQTVHLSALRGGSVRLGNSRGYEKMEGDEARRDREHQKSAQLSGDHTRITMADGREIPIIGDATRTVHGPHYYLLSLSAEWDLELFDEFRVPACLVIRDAESFRDRLISGCIATHPDRICELLAVEYFDPYERQQNHIFSPTISKDFCFAYQQEWRFVCADRRGRDAEGDDLRYTAPSLDDIAQTITRTEWHQYIGATD